jgi:sodium transport system permease protein
MSGWSTVFVKEFIDNVRDRRTLFSSFSIAILGPVFFVGMMVFVLERALGESDEAVAFGVVGAEYAPQLMAYLDQQNTIVSRVEAAQPKALVTSGAHKIVLVINSDYAERYSRGNVNTLILIHDSSEISATKRNLAQLRGHINQYARTVGMLRLWLRGLDPSISNPIATQEVDVASPAARALTILASLPYFLVLVIFMGGFYLAIDTTAGEREHGSLEPLLTQPISRAQLVIGKIAATSVFGMLSLLIFLVSLYFAVPFVPFERIGMALEIGIRQLLPVFFISIPLILFAASLLTMVASFAKSYKEAQTYLTIVVLVPTLPLIVAQLMNVETTLSIMFVPSLSQSNLMADLIKGETVEAAHVVVSMLTTSLCAGLLAWVAIILYRRERILG